MDVIGVFLVAAGFLRLIGRHLDVKHLQFVALRGKKLIASAFGAGVAVAVQRHFLFAVHAPGAPGGALDDKLRRLKRTALSDGLPGKEKRENDDAHQHNTGKAHTKHQQKKNNNTKKKHKKTKNKNSNFLSFANSYELSRACHCFRQSNDSR